MSPEFQAKIFELIAETRKTVLDSLDLLHRNLSVLGIAYLYSIHCPHCSNRHEVTYRIEGDSIESICIHNKETKNVPLYTKGYGQDQQKSFIDLLQNLQKYK